MYLAFKLVRTNDCLKLSKTLQRRRISGQKTSVIELEIKHQRNF